MLNGLAVFTISHLSLTEGLWTDDTSHMMEILYVVILAVMCIFFTDSVKKRNKEQKIKIAWILN